MSRTISRRSMARGRCGQHPAVPPGLAGLCAGHVWFAHRPDPDPLTAPTSRGWNGRCSTWRQVQGRGVLYRDWTDAQNRVEIPWCREEGPGGGARRHPRRRPAGNVRRTLSRPAVCCRLPSTYDQPVFTRVKVHRDYPRGSRPGVVLGAGASARLAAWTPASTASAGPSSSLRRPHVTRRAMISRTQVRSARPPCVYTVLIRKWSSAG